MVCRNSASALGSGGVRRWFGIAVDLGVLRNFVLLRAASRRKVFSDNGIEDRSDLKELSARTKAADSGIFKV